ncbi:MAG: cytochrome P450 [Acidimicrobiales bacterium]|jgi:cholest-4-en-3-one 26-monooxygenase
MIETDPPRHQPQRRVLSSTFTPRAVATLEADVRQVTSRCLDRVQEMGRFDFVSEVAHVIPSEVTLSLLGVPQADWVRLADLEHPALTSADPEYNAGDSGVATMDDALLALGLYFYELLNEKERTGGDDLLCHLLATPVDGQVDEFVRWASPIRHVARTATADTTVGDAAVREGDRVGIWLGACNRDGSAFPDPSAFDLARDPNPHLGFAFGQHFCLGTHLARLILRVEFEELLGRFSSIELDGEPEGVWSNFVGGLKHLPAAVSR